MEMESFPTVNQDVDCLFFFDLLGTLSQFKRPGVKYRVDYDLLLTTIN